MYLFRGDVPLAEMVDVQPAVIGLGLKAFGHRLFREYPFEEAFFLPLARQFRQALSMPLMLLGGINRLDTIEAAMADGFELVAMARALLREPDLVARMKDGSQPAGLCIHCNKCVPTTYETIRPSEARTARAAGRVGGRGTRCVLVN
jgi:2,4-dienoyl-CoA reductase-like NADH-dependent reductase (Old Yellow Enzyme family)